MYYADPHVDEFSVEGQPVEKIPDSELLAAEADVFVVITAHSDLNLTELAANGRLILDTRGVMPADAAERL